MASSRQDITVRNARASQRRDDALRGRIRNVEYRGILRLKKLEARVAALDARLTSLDRQVNDWVFP